MNINTVHRTWSVYAFAHMKTLIKFVQYLSNLTEKKAKLKSGKPKINVFRNDQMKSELCYCNTILYVQ